MSETKDVYFVKGSKHTVLINVDWVNEKATFSNQYTSEHGFEYLHQAHEVCLRLREFGIDCFIE